MDAVEVKKEKIHEERRNGHGEEEKIREEYNQSF